MKNLFKINVLFLAVLFAVNCFAMAGMERKTLKGQPAPSFSLKDLNDNKVSSVDLFGKKPIILFFWATWCPHCVRAIRRLNEIAPSLESKGAKIITIDLSESKALVASYMKEHNYNLTVLLDKDQVLAEPYGIIGVPTFFLVGKDGKIKSEENSLPEDYEKILFSE